MKIIAKKSGEKGFIVELSANEMANILGFNQLQEIDRSYSDSLSEGSEIDINKVYKSFRDIDVQKLRDNVAELQKIISSLLAKVADLPIAKLEPALPAKRKITVSDDPQRQMQEEFRRIAEAMRTGGMDVQEEDIQILPQEDHHGRSGGIFFDGSSPVWRADDYAPYHVNNDQP